MGGESMTGSVAGRKRDAMAAEGADRHRRRWRAIGRVDRDLLGVGQELS